MRMKVEDHNRELARTMLLLSEARSAKELADALGVSKVTAYKRLAELKEIGFPIQEVPMSRINQTGPVAMRYRLVTVGG